MTPGTSPKVELVLTVEGREYRREMGNAEQMLNKYGQAAQSANARLSLFTAGIGRMFGAFSAAAAAGYVVKTAKEFESLNAQLLTVEKSEPRARLAFQRIQEFAASTPFQLQEVVEAFIKLRNMGLDPSEEALTAYGNTASSMGKSLNQMIEAVADAAVGEFERLKDFGIKASSQGDKVTFTFRGVTTTVKKSSEEIQQYLMKIGNTDFAGGMTNKMQTLEGVVSNFGDSVAALATRIDSGTGLTGALKEALRWSTGLINELAGVSRPIRDIEADIASLQARLAKLPTAGRAGAARVAVAGDLKDLQDERLQAQLRSTDSGQLAAADKEMQARLTAARAALAAATARTSGEKPIMRRGKAVMSGGFDELRSVRDLESQLAALQARKASIDAADKEAAAEKKLNEERNKSVGTTVKASKAQASLQDSIEKSLRDRELENRLAGDASEVSKVRAEIELGFYKDWKPAQIERLQQLAAEKDAITDLTKALKDEDDARKKRSDEAKDIIKDLSPKATGRNFKRDLKDRKSYDAIDDVESDALANEQARFEAQRDALKDHRLEILREGGDFQALELEALQQHEDEKTRIEREAAEARKQLQEEQVAAAIDAMDQIGEAALLFGRKGFEVYKATQIAKAIISTITSAQNSFESLSSIPYVGPALGAAAAAAAVVAGYARVQQIRNMKYEGGREWGGDISPDGMVRVGERNRPELFEQDGKFFLLPGERGGKVSPAKPSSGSGGPQVIVQVINNSGEKVEQRQQRQPDGRQLQQIIIGTVLSDLHGNGQIAKAGQNRLGWTRRGDL